MNRVMITLNNHYNPPIVFHPGETLSEKLEELGMGPKEFAIRTGKPEKTIFAILGGKSSITPEMAVQFEHVLRIPAHYWLNMQRHYDEFLARQKRVALLPEAVAWASNFPVLEMMKKGWMPLQKTQEARASELLMFFGFSLHTAWEDYYLKQQLKLAFRISLRHTKQPYAISAWLRRGELQAAALPRVAYDEQAFKAVLPEIKNLMVHQPTGFFSQLQEICLDAGVKVIHTPSLQKAPISGCTRWLQDVPLIQLTGRYKRNDSFWFTFFHEVGHILLHGKKEVFLENIEYEEADQQKEKEAEANQFAVKWTFSEKEQRLLKDQITEETVQALAREIHTHPAMIIGRLQYQKKVPYTFGRRFIEPISLEG